MGAGEIKRLQTAAYDRWFQCGHGKSSASADWLSQCSDDCSLPPPRPGVNLGPLIVHRLSRKAANRGQARGRARGLNRLGSTTAPKSTMTASETCDIAAFAPQAGISRRPTRESLSSGADCRFQRIPKRSAIAASQTNPARHRAQNTAAEPKSLILRIST